MSGKGAEYLKGKALPVRLEGALATISAEMTKKAQEADAREKKAAAQADREEAQK